MRFGIDLDGVVANFTDTFKAEVNKVWLGKLEVTYQPTDWNWSDKLTTAEIDYIWGIIKRKPNFWLELRPIIENVRAIALHRIRHPQDEIFYVTARVSTKGMPVMHQTQVWLGECGISGLGTAVIVDHSGDKVPIFNSLECEANIDDKLEAVIQHDSKTNGAFLLDQPWNRVGRPPAIRVVGSLQEFFEAVRSRKHAAS